MDNARQQEQAGKPDEAAVLYQKVVDLDPENKDAVRRLLMMYRRLKDYRKELAVIGAAGAGDRRDYYCAGKGPHGGGAYDEERPVCEGKAGEHGYCGIQGQQGEEQLLRIFGSIAVNIISSFSGSCMRIGPQCFRSVRRRFMGIGRNLLCFLGGGEILR